MMFKIVRSQFKKYAIRNFKRLIHETANKLGPARLVLGIETSCDDTGAAIVDDNGNILAEALNSQLRIHLEHGGIIPQMASDMHSQNIKTVVDAVFSDSGISINDISAIATTVKPGIVLCLQVGLDYARSLVNQSGKPFIPIHHMQAHALTARMIHDVPYPFLTLLASGGHCILAIVKNVDEFLLLGSSTDISPGDCMDKVARRLKLRNLPEFSDVCGGRAIEVMASRGNPLALAFPHPLADYQDCNFSFSGLQYKAEIYLCQEEKKHGIIADGIVPNVADICASFQHAIARHMARRVQRAFIYCYQKNLLPPDNGILVLSGGVASNQYIRGVLKQLGDLIGFTLICPPPHLCTDNGIMIAWNGMERLKAGIGIMPDAENVEVIARCPIGEDVRKDVLSHAIKLKQFKIKQPVVDTQIYVKSGK